MPQNDYTDDASISNEDVIYRRIPIEHPIEHVVWDPALGRFMPSSVAFNDSRDGHPMSVVLKSVVEQNSGVVSDILEGHEGFALVELSVGMVRERGLGVARDPRPGNPAHAVVIGKKTKSVKRALARQSQWVVPPNMQPPEA